MQAHTNKPGSRVIKDPYSPTIYLLMDGKKCAFLEQKSYQRIHSPKIGFTNVDCVSAYPSGADIDPNVQLIKGKDSPKVYLAQYGQKRWISTQECYFALGFDWDRVLVVEHAILQLFKDGSPIL